MFEYKTVERPYPGLRPFEPWETSIFFGRDQHVDRLQDILRREHFLTVTGSSGSGKSSLVLAGLLPALPLGAIGTGSEWKLVRMRPGDKPLASLSAALGAEYSFQTELTKVSGKATTVQNNDLARIEAELRRGPMGLVDLVNDLRQFSAEPEFNLLVLVDQFEEIFTYAEAGNRQADEADALINLLLAASNVRAANIFIILTMRTDFLGACTRFLDLPAAINRSLFLTPRLSREQLGEAISGPASLYGMPLPPELVAEYVNAGQNDPDQLPVLQHALARRWDESQQPKTRVNAENAARNNSASFHEVGDLGKALSEHADAVYRTLDDEQRLNAQWLFRAITEQRSAQAGGQMVRRPRSLAKIADWSGRSWQDFLPILKVFADPQVSFLSYQGQPGEPANGEATVIDISHEAVMRQWRSLKTWVESEGLAAQEFAEWRDRTTRKNQGGGSYLTGADLSRAETWLKQGLAFAKPSEKAEQPASAPSAVWANRYCSDDDKITFADAEIYIRNSRKAATFLQRLLFLAAGTVVIACLLSGWFGYDAFQKSLASAAKTLWFPIHEDSELTGSAADDLIKVSAQDERTRMHFISEIFANDKIAQVFNQHHALLLRGSLKSNLKLQEQLLSQVWAATPKPDSPQIVARGLALIDLEGHLTDRGLYVGQAYALLIDAFSKAKNQNQLKALGQGLEELAGKLTDAQVAEVVAHYVDAIERSGDSLVWEMLIKDLDALADKFNDVQTAVMVTQLVNNIQKSADSNKTEAFGRVLRVLAGKLNDSQAVEVAPRFIDAVQESASSSQLEALAQGLGAVAGKLTESQAVDVAPKFINAVHSTQLEALGQDLGTLMGKLSDTEALAIMPKLIDAVQNSTEYAQMRALGQGLGALMGKLNDIQTLAVMPKLIEAVQDSDGSLEPEALGQGLSTLMGKLNDEQALAVVPILIDALQNSTDPQKMQALGQGLSVLGGTLNGTQAAAVVGHFVDVMQKSDSSTDVDAISQSLCALAGNLNNTHADMRLSILFNGLQKIPDIFQLNMLAQCLGELYGKLDEKQAATVLSHYVDVVQKNRDILMLGPSYEALAGKLNDAQVDALVSHLVGVLTESNSYLSIYTEEWIRLLRVLANSFNDRQAAIMATTLINATKKHSDWLMLNVLGQGLGSLAGTLNEAQVVAVADHYINSIDENNFYAYAFTNLTKGLEGLVSKLTNAQVATVVTHYISSIQKCTDPEQLQMLAIGLGSLTDKLTDAQASVVAPEMIGAVKHSKTGIQQAALSTATGALITKLIMDDSLAHDWLRLCDIPFIDRDAVADAIRKQYADAPKVEGGIWAFLEWANRRFGVNRPDPGQVSFIALQLFAVPFLVLLLGSFALQYLSGRQLVDVQLAKLEAKRDRRGLGLRLAGYDLDAVKTHWSVLGADERVIEQRFQWMDLLFPLAYAPAIAWALLQASDYLADPVPTNWLMGLVGVMVAADWTENAIQLLQLRRWDRERPLQASWIRVASMATQTKLLSGASLFCFLGYFCIELAFF